MMKDVYGDLEGFRLLMSARAFKKEARVGLSGAEGTTPLLGVTHPSFSQETKLVRHWTELKIEYAGG